MKIDEQELAAHGVSPELIDAIRAIPSELEHNLIVLTTRIQGEIDGLAAERGEKIRKDAEQRFVNRATDLIPRGGRLAPAVGDIIAEVREAVRLEREHLRPKTADEIFAPWLGKCEKKGWTGRERRGVAALIESTDEIVAVNFHEVILKRCKITRDDVRTWALGQRPKWLIDLPGSMPGSEFLARQGYPSDEAIAELERTAENVERQQHVRTSGPAHLVGQEYR
jgi:hypothetical protein